eukprot:TRINITY_DN14206_c0_g1_i1.p1 TRINITY_DN14206_c0_g1~~TRINITY_DN14206_c0_g1_i1.p1  ORF type:complete len:519 (+),score=83.50 TRINITY_DN14206_c0_g1_i1:205-1761(+)
MLRQSFAGAQSTHALPSADAVSTIQEVVASAHALQAAAEVATQLPMTPPALPPCFEDVVSGWKSQTCKSVAANLVTCDSFLEAVVEQVVKDEHAVATRELRSLAPTVSSFLHDRCRARALGRFEAEQLREQIRNLYSRHGLVYFAKESQDLFLDFQKCTEKQLQATWCRGVDAVSASGDLARQAVARALRVATDGANTVFSPPSDEEIRTASISAGASAARRVTARLGPQLASLDIAMARLSAEVTSTRAAVRLGAADESEDIDATQDGRLLTPPLLSPPPNAHPLRCGGGRTQERTLQELRAPSDFLPNVAAATVTIARRAAEVAANSTRQQHSAPSVLPPPQRGVAVDVILNCANLGCAYVNTLRDLGRFSREIEPFNNFSWDGVRRAVDYYQDRGLLVQGVCKNRTARLAPVPDDLRGFVIVCPVVDDIRDVDDLFTIRLAMQHGCQFIDNDNYRDWKFETQKHGSEEDVRHWLVHGEGVRLKVSYVFDCFGQFVPLTPPLSTTPWRDSGLWQRC